MKKLLFIVLMGHIASYGQLNDYKYIIVPTKFQNFKNENQFRTSTLAKYLFANEGFNTVYGNQLPDDLKGNPCLGLRVQLRDGSSLFSTKTHLALVDCNGVVILTSQEGMSKSKEYEQAYREAISESFGSFRGLNYTYGPKDGDKDPGPVTLNFKNDIWSLEEEAQTTAVHTGAKPSSKDHKGVVLPKKTGSPPLKEKDVLYAQPIDGGYQLVDIAPKVVYILKSTSAPDVFLVRKDGKNGVIFKNKDKWFVEMDEKGGKARELNIKF